MVNIYTMTNHRGLKRQSAKGLFILEAITEGREPATLTKSVRFDEVTSNAAELGTLIKALERMRRKDEVHIYTESSYLAAGFSQGWIEKWKKSDWKNAKGEEVANKELWIRLIEQIEVHIYEIHVNEAHAYREWMRRELKGANHV